MLRGLYLPIMEIDSLYIKDEDINNVRGNRQIKLCEYFGAQNMNNIWLMYPTIREVLIVSGFVLNGKKYLGVDENSIKLDGNNQNVLLSKTFWPQYPLMWTWPFSRGIINSN